MTREQTTARASAARLVRQYLHTFAAAACVGPFLSYVLTAAGWSPSYIGYAAATLTASAVITAPMWGRLDDALHGGAARLSFGATAVASVALTVAVVVGPDAAVWVAIASLGAGSGSLEALLTTRTLRDARTARRLGTIRSAGSVGWILGLVVGALLITVTDRPAVVFLVAAAAAAFAPRPARDVRHLAVAAPQGAYPLPPTHVVAPDPDCGRAHRAARLPLRQVVYVLSLTLPVPLTTATLVFFTAGWASTELSAGPLLAIAPLALSAGLELPAFVAVDRLARRVRPVTLIALAFPPMIVATSLLATTPTRLVMLGVQPLVACTFALWYVAQSRLIAERVPLERLATAQTLVSSLSRGVAGPVGAIFGGTIAEAGGYRALFLAMTFVSIAGLLRALGAHRRTPRPVLEDPCPAG